MHVGPGESRRHSMRIQSNIHSIQQTHESLLWVDKRLLKIISEWPLFQVKPSTYSAIYLMVTRSDICLCPNLTTHYDLSNTDSCFL